MSGGSITVHRPELCRELLERSAEDREGKGNIPPPQYVSPTHEGRVSPARAPSRVQMARIEEWLSQKARRAVVALPDDPELAQIKELCQQILDEEQSFFSELERFLTSQEEEVHCKREMLYRKWSERVFDPIQSRLASQVNSHGYKTLDTRKRRLFEQYLNYRNKKAVFLDTISQEEYDPLQLSHGEETLKVATGHLDDPLISQAADYTNEQLVIQGCEQGLPPPLATPPPHLGREDTNCALWLAMQLVHIDSQARRRSRNRTKGIRNDSHLDRDKWERVEPSPELIKQELQIPHKTPIKYDRKPFKLDWKT